MTRNRRILIIDDALEIQILIRHLFLDEGYIVDYANNGKEGLDLLHSATELPSVILLDLMMPVMDGLEFMKNLEADVQLREIPVVVMTAYGPGEVKKMELQGREILKKPVEIDALLGMAARYCSKPVPPQAKIS